MTTDNKDVTFYDFLSMEHLFLNKPYNSEIKNSYIKISAYILKNKNINIEKVKESADILNLYKDLENNSDFEKTDKDNRDKQLYVLFRFYEYMKYKNSL